MDSGRSDTGTPDAGTPMDSGTPEDAGGGGSRGCDPLDPEACAEGQRCQLVFEGMTQDGGSFQIDDVVTDCVDEPETPKFEGAPCGFSDPDPGSEPETLVDDCAQGFFCVLTDGIRRCTTLCSGMRVDCGQNGYCLGQGEGLPGLCSQASNCDAVFQTGCEEGEACYVLTGTRGQVVSDCFEPQLGDGGVGMAGDTCMFLDQCAAGFQCTPDVTDAGVTGTSCREICAAEAAMDGGVADAGMADGGMAGSCSQAEDTCAPFLPGGDAGVRSPTAPGFCEMQ
jgi:hypothetical protein